MKAETFVGIIVLGIPDFKSPLISSINTNEAYRLVRSHDLMSLPIITLSRFRKSHAIIFSTISGESGSVENPNEWKECLF